LEASPNTAAIISIRTSKCMFMWLVETVANVPATNNKESPGKKGVTTNPVSRKIRKKRIA
jgi:hypothetical protein